MNELMRCDALNADGKRCGNEGTGYRAGVWVCRAHGSRAERYRQHGRLVRKQNPGEMTPEMREQARERAREQRAREMREKVARWVRDGAKECATCGKVKPLGQFSLVTLRSGNRSLRGDCKLCRKKKRMVWDARREQQGLAQTAAAQARREHARRQLQAVEAAGERACAMCGETLPLHQFGTRRAESGGVTYQSYCRRCHAQYKRTAA